MKKTLFDLTTIVSANNALNCQSASYPKSTINPYTNLLNGVSSNQDSPIWLEMSSLSDLIEAIIIHDKIVVFDIFENDRILDRGRYQTTDSFDLFSSLMSLGIVEKISIPNSRAEQVIEWIKHMEKDDDFVENLLESFFKILKQPFYNNIPDLFSHSQTVYKFDGESVWNNIKEQINLRKFARKYKRMKKKLGFDPKLKFTDFFYPEDIFAFLIRGILYNELSKSEGYIYHPHPARSMLALSDGLFYNGVIDNPAKIPINFISDIRNEVAKNQNSELKNNLFELDIPPVFAKVLKEAKSPKDILNNAIELRNSKSAKAYRKWIEEMYGNNEGLKAIEVQRQLRQLKDKMSLEFGLSDQSYELNLWIFVFYLKFPHWSQKVFQYNIKSHIQFVRNLYHSSLNVMNLENELIRIFK